MQKTSLHKHEFLLMGISIRTNNEQEIDPLTRKIAPCVKRYFHEAISDKITNRKNPGTTICAYTNYESDHTGEYTYFIGEEVISFNGFLPEGLSKLIVPSQKYTKFTTNPGPMPDVVITAWQNIWKMSFDDLGGDRRYHTDFELYDIRAANHNNVMVDLFIGIK